MAKKKRNPQDSTLRNVRAANKAIRSLAVRVVELEERISSVEKRFDFAPERRNK